MMENQNKQTAKKRPETGFLLLFFFTVFIFPLTTWAGLSFGNGYYTNLCGSGTAASFYNCSGLCIPSTGSCRSDFDSNNNPRSWWVFKFICNGNGSECGGGGLTPFREEKYGAGVGAINIASGVFCGQTSQVDVFSKDCRPGSGGWVCNSSDLKGYMVWYSGDCLPIAPTVDLKANNSDGPITISHNNAAALSWTTINNPTSCIASNGWSGSKAIPSGSESTGNLTGHKTYTLTCNNSAGSAADSVLVQVLYCSASPPNPPA